MAEMHTSAALNEVNYGSLYRKSKKWVAANVPEYKTDPDFVFPGGESFNQMQARSVELVRKLALERRPDRMCCWWCMPGSSAV